jgi:uncharacterized protein YPO0396
MSDGLFAAVELGSVAGAGYRLHHLEVLNWGTFDGQVWRLDLTGESTLLTGDIGSGKSTLVDALITLLMPANRIAYNKAAGADAKERTLRSYVEGHYKSERSEASGKSRSIGLRAGPSTYSVVIGVFVNEGYDETVSIAQVFQQRESAGQPYRFYVTATKALSLADDFADFGSTLPELRRRLRAGGAEVFDDFPKYSTSLRRLLGVRSEQALELFHQTVSMKSVGNLNEFVRDHMLEPSDSSDRIRDIITHFEDLTKAHDAVKRAREQLEALDPIVAISARYDAAVHERTGLEGERDALRLFVAERRSAMLAGEIAELEAEGARLWQEQDTVKEQQRRLSAERDAFIEARASAGGDRVGELERLAREAREQADQRMGLRTQFDAAVTEAGLVPVTDVSGFATLSGAVAAARQRTAQAKRDLDAATADAVGRERTLATRQVVLEHELDSLAQRTNNLPVDQVDIRAQMCEDLLLTPDDLPYAGELIDVADEFTDWRGAAERVLRGFALSLLVREEHYDSVVRWVNDHRIAARGRAAGSAGSKLVYERVPLRHVRVHRERGVHLVLADCLEAKDGPFQDYLVAELARRADHRCAVTIEEFRHERRAVTREGQVRSGDRHEKDDRHRVNDPRRWVLGWANESKSDALRIELASVTADRQSAADEVGALDEASASLLRRQEALVRIESVTSWLDVDPDEATSRADRHDAERTRLQSGSTRLEEIGRALAENEAVAGDVAKTIEELTGRLATTAREAERAMQAKRRDDEIVSAQSTGDLEAARASYPALDTRVGPALPATSSDFSDVETGLTTVLHARIEKATKELGGYGTSLVQHMNDVLRRWPELRNDLDATVDSRHDFLVLRQRVADDDLPRFESEFKEQLNKNAIQEIAAFNNWLNRQAGVIDERVSRINEALAAVPYNPGRYIRLEKEPTLNQEIAQFRAELRGLTNDALAIDGEQYSEQRFLDVKRIIERFRGRDGYSESDRAWTRRVTDVRNWFVFSASERDLQTGEEWEHYSDSDGKSGGQKEKLAYTILAASLAYQFGLEWGVTRSKDFRFAVIDEAFGRGSDVSTRYALELFAKLGLQLLIVTPLQKVHVIEPYVRAIGFVDNPTGTSSRLHTMTIEEYRHLRAKARS